MNAINIKSLIIVSLLSASGCHRAATGQVVAVVNGEEVSISELNGELQASGVSSEGGDKAAIHSRALQSIIDRKLLAQAARDRGIDKDPQYLQQQRRVDEQLMINMLAKQVTKNVPVPTGSDIDGYIAKHPEIFAQRTIYALNQIQFAAPADRSKLKTLEADHSLDAVAASLTRLSIPFTSQKGSIDTATTPSALTRQITSLPPTEPFILSSNGRVIVSVIIDKQVVPLGGDQARRLAGDLLRRDAVTEIANSQVKQARAAAKIEYQPGYGPAAVKK